MRPGRQRSPRHTRLLLAALAVLLIGTTLPSGVTHAQQVLPCDSGSGSFSRVSRPAKYEILPQEIIHLPSDVDGATIEIGLLRPDVPGRARVPVIVVASPYFHPMSTLDLRSCPSVARLSENFVGLGYAVAAIAVRGTGDSGGCMNLMGPGERADLDQAVTWLGTRSWSNGSVGMAGLSYDGSTPWQVAAAGNPHLKTIVPASGVPDLFDLMYGGGVVDWRGPAILNDIYYLESVGFYLPGRSVDSTLQVIACPEYAEANAAAVHSAHTGELDPLGYWAQRRYRDEVKDNYSGSVLLVQGLQDWNVNPGQQFPWVNELIDAGIPTKLMLGQWGHAHPDGQRPDWADVLLPWFDRYLKGDTAADVGAPVEVRDSAGRWRTAGVWPPQGSDRTLWLTADGALADMPGDDVASRTVMLDPFHLQGGNQQIDLPEDVRQLCEPLTCAVFTTAPLDEELHFAGLPQARLTVTPQGPNAQLSIYLFAVAEEGSSRLGWGQVDLRFPGGTVRGTPQAGTVTPGEEMIVDFPLQPLDAVVPAGARLAMVVSGGSAYNRLPGVLNHPVDVAVGAGRSALTLAQVTAGVGDFFDPGSN